MNLLDYDEGLKVISGMQNGVDQAALYAAETVGIATGGHAPKGYRTLDGNMPELGKRFGLAEDVHREYPPRTELNVMNADMTVQIAYDFDSPGERLTSRYVNMHSKPSFHVMVHNARDEFPKDSWVIANGLAIPNLARDALTQALIINNIQTLNVAGNSEKTAPGIQELTYNFLLGVFITWKETMKGIS